MAKLKLDPKALGLACGTIWGIGVALFAISGMYGWGLQVGTLLALYPGYAPTPLGAVIGFVWGFVDAFIGGYILAWLYNYFSK